MRVAITQDLSYAASKGKEAWDKAGRGAEALHLPAAQYLDWQLAGYVQGANEVALHTAEIADFSLMLL